ncbi:leucine-rich repeat domain-containing protein [Thalassotalea psychrophila]|uniref:Leucine-rich repeat domain-containing protein n=1 Tax=Thalassotalea psychrophila TaxID=3065647 RepID=A0ABY9TYA4_9GAMM|nr:leucine-rich repeat domain-containing protein [Colwelliaceae bacterium SQ149]
MTSHISLKRMIRASLLTSCAILTGCGGSSAGGGTSPNIEPPANVAPSVIIDGTNRAQERSTITLLAVASDVDGTIASYNWQVSGANVELIGQDSSALTLTLPSVDQDTAFNVTVEVTDNDDQSASQTLVVTSEAIYDTISIHGLVTDEVISYADVLLEVGDQQFTTQADSFGHYFFEDIEVNERNYNALVKLSAFGNNNYSPGPGVEFVSLLASFNHLKQAAGRDGILEMHELLGVNITNYSTAQFVLAEQIHLQSIAEAASNDGYSIITTDVELEQAVAAINAEQLVDLAAVIKVIVDNEEFSLPQGVNSTLELAADAELVSQSKSAMLLSQPDIIEQTILVIEADENLVENPDFDNDGIPDREDDDIDNDGVLNDDDFFPRDFDQYAPLLGMIKDQFQTNPNGVAPLYTCINIASHDVEAGVPTADISVLEIHTLKCAIISAAAEPVLKYFTNLKHLNLTGSAVSPNALNDISAIAGLTKLESLNLGFTQVSDFSVVANLTNLVELELNNTTGFTTTVLANLSQLERLNLSNTGISVLTGIDNATSLNELELSNNELTDAGSLAALPALTSLQLNDNQLSVMPVLSASDSLTSLNLANNTLNDTVNLSGLTALQALNLNYNQANNAQGLNINGLVSLTELRTLELIANNITDVSALAGLTALTGLELANNTIVNASPLASLQQLTQLGLNNNHISQIGDEQGSLVDLTKLTVFNLSNNQLSDMPILAGFTHLTEIKLANNQIGDLTGIVELASVSELDLTNNNLTSVTPLLSWSSLPAQLLLSDNDISCGDGSAQQIISKAEQHQISLFLDDCQPKLTLLDDVSGLIWKLDIFGLPSTGGTGGSSAPTGRTISNDGILWKERNNCVFVQQYMDAPVCWTHVMYSLDCVGSAGDTMLECRNNALPAGHYPPMQLDVDYGRKADNIFVNDFSARSILSVLGVYHKEATVTCSELDENSLASCTLTSDLLSGDAITWQQNHTFTTMPNCNGKEGESVAMCIPTAATIGQDVYDPAQSEFSFELDLTTRPIQSREESETCDPNTPGSC